MGASWKTGLVGVVAIIAAVGGLAADIFMKQGMPDTVPEWLVFGSLLLGGLGSLFAKDHDVSNAPHPSVATVVTTAEAVVPKPPTTAPPVPVVK